MPAAVITSYSIHYTKLYEGRWKELKKAKPQLVIAVGGCVASQEGDAIRTRAPIVDVVFGPQTLHRLPEMIKKVHEGNGAQVDVSFPEIEKFDRLPEPRAEGPTAFVSIMEGCSKYCSYCVVPYTRGEEVSRPLDDVLFEIAQLAEQGVRDVITSYSIHYTKLYESPSRRSRSSTACRSRGPKAPPPSSPSWKAVPSTALSAWCPIRGARRSAARS